MKKNIYLKKFKKITNISPTRIIVFSFALVVLIGATLLSLPIASKTGYSLGFINSLFTATSATCVTGLSIYDIYNTYTYFGQIVILILIQLGGLGIVTFTTFFTILLGKRVGLKGMLLAQESLNNFNFSGIVGLVKKIVIASLSIELIGAILLSIKFIPMAGIKGIYFGLFHSVSAFCNAGFDIMSAFNESSLTFFKDDPFVLITISFLIIIGGLGFVVWKDIYEYRKTKQFKLHTKLVFSMSIILILIGTIIIFNLEMHNASTLKDMNLQTKILNSYFTSVSTRTAGFNTFDLGSTNEITKFFISIFMFIGASPGSTGGGIKTTTLGIILFAILSQIKGSNYTIISKRRIPFYIVIKALTIAGLSMIIVILITTFLLIFNPRPFIDLLFLGSSAFGTVGLSTFSLANLSTFSKLIIIVSMFLGRVGALSFGIALTLKSNKKKTIYPEGEVLVG
jgi:trk system potassium uptake protein TrkH